jgi:hypothetical protein
VCLFARVPAAWHADSMLLIHPHPQLFSNRDARRAVRAVRRINMEVEALNLLSPHTNINKSVG